MAVQLDPQLELRITEVSSQAPDFPPEVILQGDPLSLGWRTQDESQPPHFISLQIAQGLAEVTQIQFVAHETFTPLNVEVQYRNGGSFEKLGHVKMNENTEGRQRKTFKIKIRTSEIKLVMHDVIQSKDNPNKQVSLTSLIVRGKLCQQMRPGSAAMSAVDNRSMPDAVKQQISQNEVYNERITKLISQLQIDEAKFVQSDQYLEAERVKTASGKILNFAKALDALEIKKAVAVKKKDYRAAATIKDSIDEIKGLLDEDYQDMICILNNEPKRPRPVQQPAARTVQQPVQTAKPVAVVATAAQDQGPAYTVMDEQAPESQIPQTNTNHNEDRPINAPQQQGYGFQLSEEEKAEIEAERAKRAEEMKKERLAKLGKNPTASGKKEQPVAQNEKQVKQERQEQAITASRTDGHFDSKDAFDFDRSMSQLTQYWEASDQKPPVLPPSVAHTDECNILLASRFSEIFVRLLCSKNMEHISDAVSFMDQALHQDAAKFCDSGIALIDILGQNNNLALLNHSNKVFVWCYLGILLKHAGDQLSQFALSVYFDNVEQALMQQKDTAVLYAQLCVGNKRGKTAEDINSLIYKAVQGNTGFASDVLRLLEAPYNRITEKQHRAFIQAINMLATVASLPGFPDKQFFAQLLQESQINRQSQMKAQDQNFGNQKYLSVVEARAVAAAMILQQAPWLVSQQTVSIIVQFLLFALPSATKTEFKNAMMVILGLCYEADELLQPSEVIQTLDKMQLKNEKIKQEIDQIFKASDERREGSQRVLYNQQKKGFIEASSTMMFSQNIDEFGPGVCQFCLFDTKNTDLKVMHRHLLLECPCCTICPACRMLVEVPFISEHLLFSCQAKDAYQLKQCPKCMNAFDVSEYQQHFEECQIKLKGEESCCPLCSTICPDGEASLIHHSDGLCISNVRTSLELKNVVKAKVDGK